MRARDDGFTLVEAIAALALAAIAAAGLMSTLGTSRARTVESEARKQALAEPRQLLACPGPSRWARKTSPTRTYGKSMSRSRGPRRAKRGSRVLPPIGSRPMNKHSRNNDGGFTLTELIAGLLVASLLIAGIVDIVRRYARTTGEVREAAADIRSARLLDAMMDELVRLDPGSQRVSPQDIGGTIGGAPVTARLVREAEATRLEWSSPVTTRSITLAEGAQFSRNASGAIVLTAGNDPVPLALVIPRRTLPFDCQFDTVSRVCRQ